MKKRQEKGHPLIFFSINKKSLFITQPHHLKKFLKNKKAYNSFHCVKRSIFDLNDINGKMFTEHNKIDSRAK